MFGRAWRMIQEQIKRPSAMSARRGRERRASRAGTAQVCDAAAASRSPCWPDLPPAGSVRLRLRLHARRSASPSTCGQTTHASATTALQGAAPADTQQTRIHAHAALVWNVQPRARDRHARVPPCGRRPIVATKEGATFTRTRLVMDGAPGTAGASPGVIASLRTDATAVYAVLEYLGSHPCAHRWCTIHTAVPHRCASPREIA